MCRRERSKQEIKTREETIPIKDKDKNIFKEDSILNMRLKLHYNPCKLPIIKVQSPFSNGAAIHSQLHAGGQHKAVKVNNQKNMYNLSSVTHLGHHSSATSSNQYKGLHTQYLTQLAKQ